MTGPSLRRAVLSVLLGSALVASPSGAQGNRRTNVTVSGFPLTVASTTAAAFTAGAVTFGTTSFTVDLRTNSGGGGFSPRVTTVQVRCGAGCPASVAQVQWRRADLGTWNSLSTVFTTIEARTATFNNPASDPWSRSMEWRYVLLWATTPPSAQRQFSIDFQLVVTAP